MTSDVRGAKAFGMRTIWIDRAEAIRRANAKDAAKQPAADEQQINTKPSSPLACTPTPKEKPPADMDGVVHCVSAIEAVIEGLLQGNPDADAPSAKRIKTV